MNSAHLLTPPDRVCILAVEDRLHPAARTAAGERFHCNDVTVAFASSSHGLAVRITAATTPLRRVQLRWKLAVPLEAQILGDAWERAYGELSWRGHEADRCLPWYFLLHETGPRLTHAVGVGVQPNTICFWQVDPQGVSLWLDVGCGGGCVHLSGRTLEAATILTRSYPAHVTPFSAARDFCTVMCPRPRLPAEPVIGSNDWYYAWGKNTPDQLLADADLLRELAPPGGPAPFVVIDDGWQLTLPCGGGPWHSGNATFADMPGLAAAIRARGCRPGIWMRPLGRNPTLPAHLRVTTPEKPAPGMHWELDPSRPEVLASIAEGIRGIVDWGYELIKHDFSVFDLFGRGGAIMGYQIKGNGLFGHQLTQPGWTFADRTRTTAEIALDLYRTIREAAGDQTLIMGCNTLSHLSAGLFEIMRTGDDNSSKEWERTRRMGINALAFRMPQHGTFYAADADIAPLGPEAPWEYNRQWLDLLGRSGTALFFSCPRHQVVGEIKDALREALARAGASTAPAEPLDWMHTASPQRWRDAAGQVVDYDWFGTDGIAIP